MTNWIKDKDGKYINSTNNINISEFNEYLNNEPILNDTNTLNDKIVYLPVHNIKDIYEWYRIFNDAYIYNAKPDKYGFAIHCYFDKKRGASIEGWFPNLYKVKTISTDLIKYDTDGINYYRSSIDYITNFFNIPELILDGINILEDDLVLLKNQNREELTLFTIDQTLSVGNLIYVEVIDGDEIYFKIGSTIIIKTNTGFVEDKIKNIFYDTLNNTEYIIITTLNETQGTQVGDINNGNYLFESYENQNGIYKYTNNNLILIDDMYDKYKTYNQIIYSYLGNTNTNVEYYLRRNEIKFSSNYSQYPISGINEALYYSKGSAYLVKFQINYNLSYEIESNLNLNSCCGCNGGNIDDAVEHPLDGGPHALETNPFRLLYLDYTQAKKIFTTDSSGIPVYFLENDFLELGNIDTTMTITSTDNNAEQNFLRKYFENKFINSPVNTNSFIFEHIELNQYETLDPSFNSNFNNINIIQNTTTTTINFEYNQTQYKLPINTYNPGTLVMFQFLFKIDGKIKNTLDETFQIVNVINDANNLEIEIFPQLDNNFINEFEFAKITPNEINCDVKFISKYGKINGNFIKNTQALFDRFDDTILSKVYLFKYILNGTNNTSKLYLENIRPNIDFTYDNYGTTINIDGNTAVIKPYRNRDFSIYNKFYTITKFLNQYLGINPYNIDSRNNINAIYNVNDGFDTFRFIGSQKNDLIVLKYGTIIEFGKNYKENILDNIGKNTSLIINYLDINETTLLHVVKVEFDDISNYGRIYLNKYIQKPNNGENIELNVQKSISYLSSSLKTIFEKTINGANIQNTIEYDLYKPDTSFYAYSLIQKNDDSDQLLSSLTGILYKDFNEPQISLIKRDRFFNFPNDALVNVAIDSSSNVDLNSPIFIIDGYTLVVDDLVLLNNQLDPIENGIYVYLIDNTLFRYSEFNITTYWKLNNGININKEYIAYYDLPYTPVTPVQFLEKSYRRKNDPRLTFKPIGIAKLGVDNKTNKFRKISSKYDTREVSENLFIIEPNINKINKIRFINGLSEFNILNNIAGQEQYAWILDDNVIVENAVVGCTQINGPGTGDLIWYTGTWVQGSWCDGIWIQGLWKNGTWYNGIWNAYGIQDNNTNVIYNNIQDNLLSTWKSGTWVNGVFNGGIISDILWINGTFNGGIINGGIWTNGTFNGGIIGYVQWNNGLMTGGEFRTGIWEKGILKSANPNEPAKFGINSSITNTFKSRAIWRTGLFDGGEFHSGNNNKDHNSSIFYSGEFINSIFYGGSFITGTFNLSTWFNGVWFGGFKCTIMNDIADKKLVQINPAQYDEILGLINLSNYIPNMKHNIHLYDNSFYLLATPTNNNNFIKDAFINISDQTTNIVYQTKNYINNSATTISLLLAISYEDAETTTYQINNTTTNQPNGYPFICAEFSGVWKNGIFLNGIFLNGIFEQGQFVNGYIINGTFGNI